MNRPVKIVIFCMLISVFQLMGAKNSMTNIANTFIFQNDSTNSYLIKQLLNSNLEELNSKSSDSIELFKKVSLTYAELLQPSEALIYANKYISNTADISIIERDSFKKIENSQEYQSLKNNYSVRFNLLIVIYFYIAFVGFFFATVINFRKKSDRISRYLIGGFVIVHSLFILDFALYTSNIRYQFPHVSYMSSTVSLLYGPLLYLYFRRLTQRYRINLKDLLHIIPFVVLILILLPFYQISAEEKLLVMFDLNDQFSRDNLFFTVFIPKLTSYIIYGVLIGKLYFNETNSITSNKDVDLIRWKKNIYHIHVLYMLSYLIYGFSIKGIIIEQSDFIYHSQMLAMSFMVMYIAQMAYVRPKLFDYNTLMNINDYFNRTKYAKSGLTDSLSEELKSILLNLLMVEKVYKDSGINLKTIATKLETTRHSASQLINEQFNMNFFELINAFRIEEAKKLLRDDINNNLNIIDIAYEVGYNNKVTFNKAFKKETGLTPTQYLKSIRNKKSVSKQKGILSRVQ